MLPLSRGYGALPSLHLAMSASPMVLRTNGSGIGISADRAGRRGSGACRRHSSRVGRRSAERSECACNRRWRHDRCAQGRFHRKILRSALVSARRFQRWRGCVHRTQEGVEWYSFDDAESFARACARAAQTGVWRRQLRFCDRLGRPWHDDRRCRRSCGRLFAGYARSGERLLDSYWWHSRRTERGARHQR